MTEEEQLDMFPPENDPMVLAIAEENLKASNSKAKKKAIENLVVENHNVKYLGDDLSQLRMASTIAIANQMFNKKIGETFIQMSQDPAISEDAQAMLGKIGQLLGAVYKGVYKDNKINWKGADSKVHTVEVESIAEALLKAMLSVGGIVTKEK